MKPTILFCHGFPGAISLKEFLPELGDNWVEVDYQGDKEGLFSFLGSIDDIKKKAEEVRKGEVWAIGYSYGGFCVANLARKDPGVFEKIILINPLLDATFLRDDPIMELLWEDAARTIALRPGSFYEEEIERICKDFNPIEFASEIKTPIVIVQGMKDDLLPIDVVEDFYAKLNCKKNIIRIPGMSHQLDVQIMIEVIQKEIEN